MQSITTTTAKSPLFKRAAAALLLLLFLGINLVSLSHTLHSEVHHDASEANHDCVFVQVADGHCLTENTPACAVPPVVSRHCGIIATAFVFLPESDFLLLPGRAPPVSPA